MEKCAFCPEPATVHITDMKRGDYRELHLCQKCADKEQSVAVQKPPSLEHYIKTVIAAYAGGATGDLARLTCPACGLPYMEFRSGGRLGCATEYEVFKPGLLPLLQRVHGHVSHTGKRPRRGAATPGSQAVFVQLRRQLRDAIDREQYELAAQLRDQIRGKGVSA